MLDCEGILITSKYGEELLEVHFVFKIWSKRKKKDTEKGLEVRAPFPSPTIAKVITRFFLHTSLVRQCSLH